MFNYHSVVKPPFFLIVIFLCLMPICFALAENSSHPIYVTPKAGYSLFTGVFGLEFQYSHVALDIGIFPSGGIRYYFRPRRHSWFAGFYGTGIGNDNTETKDNVEYKHYSSIQGGAGTGYRWLWRSNWNLELGATVGYEKQVWTNPSVKRTATVVAFTPLATVGYSF